MKKCLPFLIAIILLQNSYAQKKSQSLLLSIGKCWHGTGDLKGIIVDVLYDRTITKRIDFSNGLTTTINYGKDEGLNFFSPGSSPDERLLHFTTAGIQLTSLLNWAFIYSEKFQLKASAGSLFRFQSASTSDNYSYHQNPSVYPEPFYVFYGGYIQNTFTIGYTAGISFFTPFSKKYRAGIKTFFQNDTNGDVITSISFIIEKTI